MELGIDCWSILARFWEGFGKPKPTKNRSKKKSKNRTRKMRAKNAQWAGKGGERTNRRLLGPGEAEMGSVRSTLRGVPPLAPNRWSRAFGGSIDLSWPPCVRCRFFRFLFAIFAKKRFLGIFDFMFLDVSERILNDVFQFGVFLMIIVISVLFNLLAVTII